MLIGCLAVPMPVKAEELPPVETTKAAEEAGDVNQPEGTTEENGQPNTDTEINDTSDQEQADSKQAANEGTETGQTGENTDNGQTQDTVDGMESTPPDEETGGTAEEDVLSEQQGLKANSWRFRDGEMLMTPQYRSRAGSYPHAWEKVNGVYMNSAGEPIEGALEKGIDVSYAQGKIDWEKVKADGIDFAIIQCGYGNDYASQDDKYWAYNVSECERLGIPYGVYIYSYATNVKMAKSEAEHVLRLLNGHNPTYPVYFDMEDDSTKDVKPEIKGQMAETFCNTVSAQGYDVGIYANLNWWNTQLTSPKFQNPSWSKWVAQYNVTCDYDGEYDIWQATSEGTVDGINGRVDVNFWMNPNKRYGESGATLAVRRGNEYHFKYSLGNGPADLVINYGNSNDIILVGDWDGDGVDTLCVRRGNTYYFKNSLSSGEADKVVSYGRRNDEVYVGDWDGDGVDTLCVRRGNTYYIKNSLSDGAADRVVAYGKSADSILTGDWDGDGVDTLCVRRGNTYHVKNSLSNGAADAVIPYGKSSDVIIVGDWDADRMDTLCVRRGSEYHFKNSIQAGEADQIIVYGKKTDTVYAGKWR